MSISPSSHISSFIQFDPQETFEREFFVTHTSLKRFQVGNIVVILVTLLVLAFPAWLWWTIAGHEGNDSEKAVSSVAFVLSLIPAAIVVLYYLLRKPRVSYGYATLTNKRIIYYEYNTHPAVNYHYVRSLYLPEITAASFSVDRTLFRKSFYMALYTEFEALKVGGKTWLGILRIFSRPLHLEPGPDALEFVQTMSGQIAHRQFEPQWSSHTA
jgi:hypothetical protein